MASKRVGVISINLTAGTANFIADLDKANAKVTDFTNKGVRGFQQFGEHSVSSMQATSGSLRLLEGNFTNNIRASERFLATTLGLGPVLQNAFPLVGGLAFGGLLVDMGLKAYDFYKKMEQGPERVAGAFRELNAPIRQSNDELQLSIDKVQREIDVLQGKHTNSVKIMLDEAIVSADHLAASLQGDIDKLAKLLKDDSSWTSQAGKILSGQQIPDDFLKKLTGQSGFGGAPADIDRITQEGNAKIEAAKKLNDLAAANNARTETKAKLEAVINGLIKDRNQALQGYETREKRSAGPQPIIPGAMAPTVNLFAPSQTGEIEKAKKVIQDLQDYKTHISKTYELESDTQTRTGLQDQASNAKMDRPFEDRIKAMKAQLEDLKSKLSSVGQTDAFRAITQGHGEAVKIIEEVNKALERYHRSLTPGQKAEIDALAVQQKQTEVETAYQTKLDSTTRSIQERIAAAQALTAAIGKGYEATKAATVNTQVATTMGREYNDPARAGDQAKLKAQLESEFEAKHREEITATLDKLGDQIELEKALAAAQRQGAEAVRQAELAYKLDQIAKNNDADSAKKLIAAEKELYAATQANHSAETIAKIVDETAALKRLTAAAVEGAEAIRKAKEGNQFEALGKQGGTQVPGMIGVSQEQVAAAGKDQAAHENEVTDAAMKRVNVYNDQLKSLSEQLAVLKDYQSTHQDDLNVAIAIRDVENETLDVLGKQALSTGTLSGGLKAFFAEAAANAKKPGDVLKDGLNSAVDGVSDQLSKLMTGQKTDWGKMLQSVGGGMAKEATKSMLQQGLGAVGKKLFPGLSPKVKPTGAPGDPVHVWQDNPSGGGGISSPLSAIGLPPGIASTILPTLAPLAGAAAGTLAGSATSIFHPSTDIAPTPRAAGGPVTPDQAYWVGENGPEPFVPRSAGTIIPNDALRGGGDTYHITQNFDNRNADLGAGQRVREAAAIHRQAVTDALRSSQEHAKRMPHR